MQVTLVAVTLDGVTDRDPKFTLLVDDSPVPVMSMGTAWWLWDGLIEVMTGATAPPWI
ncbi:hypothetical protein GCM10009863_64110 [Streptomyces axinellae]|uniref:Uncharacterized protein n=1 Tax=Streptomyces axinellae TaxID=552788 RepID=A0ABN3QYY5_9ACTN